ncbi:MAG: aldehyde dehydrogenase [Phycisphaeraceae bacterium]|nr:aldehyde dehydrogenase [Phycisphaeraceae bacterium]
MTDLPNHIGGEFRAPERDAWLDVIEPATGRPYARVADSGAADVDAAVHAARAAYPGWSGLSARDRARAIMRLADLLERDIEPLARAESIDTGKPIALARRVDIPRAIANFRFFAGASIHASGEFHDMPGEAINYTLRRPRGVAGLISPWNLPLYLLSWKIAPAIATGNTAVAKPSEVTPKTATMLAALASESGLPPGVLNIVHGRGPTAGAALVEHPLVPAISFTGSTRAGRWIAGRCGESLKRVSLELGGKNPNVIFADADLDQACETAVRAAFTNQGQICLCGSRVLVQCSAYEQVVERIAAGARGLVPGDPLEDETRFGALVSAEHLDKVQSAVESARRLGGQVLAGGRRAGPPNARCEGGCFYEPTVIAGLDPACEIEREEIFGPVVTVTPFDDEDHAVALANGTPYGLAAMLWTRDLSRAHRVAERIEAGIVWVNCWMLRDLRTPFGGTKDSGVGREGGLEALRFFTEPKNVCAKI